MKLIIDIDEKLFNLVIERTQSGYIGSDVWIAVANGIPINTVGDTISRKALKEDMKSRLSACNEWIEKAKDKETKIRASAVKAYIAEVIMTIDNAPTVTVDNYAMGYQDGVRKVLSEMYKNEQKENNND